MTRERMLRTRQLKLVTSLQNIGSTLLVLLLLIGGFWGSHYLLPGDTGDASALETSDRKDGDPIEVTMQTEKVASAGIHVTEVECVELQEMKTVSATVEYDSTRHLSIKAPVACVVGRWHVKPGQVVAKGDRLALLSGAEVALARSEVRKCEADVRIAKINFDWSKETQDNLAKLLTTLKQKPTVEEVEAEFDGKLLGEHRTHLLTAYTKYVLANSVATRAKPLGERGIIAGSKTEERLSQRDVAATAFKTACEQSEFEGRQDLAKTRAELDLAEQQLAVAQERMRLLLGPLADHSASQAPAEFEIRAPFDGRIEALHTSPASRLAQGEAILTLADTTKLWVSALIHQHDWEALQVAASESVRVTVPAIPDVEFHAQVSFVGPEVSPSTRAISLVAELDNQEGRFRPGMFAWVALPMEPKHHGLIVPTAAIQRHEAQAFVFVAIGKNRFRRVDVATGIETADHVEVTAGLSSGQKIVDQGAFYLKSELLLEQEAE